MGHRVGGGNGGSAHAANQLGGQSTWSTANIQDALAWRYAGKVREQR
jgi:hypothetical protein